MSFLYTGPNAIQTGVGANTIVADRLAVLRGRVLSASGTPLPAVTVTVADHPEYGRTLSRADGMYDLAINGGAPVRLSFEKSGFITAQRLITSKWNDQRGVADVVLVGYDANATTVTMSAAEMQVAQGSLSTDADGVRRARVLFPAGTAASLVLPNGSIQSAPSLTIRATEFSVGANGPKAMPGALPAASAYTYCVELSADEAVTLGATEIRFSQAVPFYVENFLGFPVGVVVPAGYYDRVRGAWMASENGRVIKVLSVTGGLADLDTNGDGAADDDALLRSRGIDAAERKQVAVLYAPGQTLWRVPLTHFTPLDCNWPWGPPEDASAPSTGAPRRRRNAEETCRLPNASVVDCHNQTLGEEVPIAGTPFTLIYDSGRIARGAFRTDIELSNASLPASVRSIELNVEIAGQTYHSSFSPQTNLSVPFIWDGRDAYGRTVQGAREATVSIGYVYNAEYKTPPEFDRAWAAFTNTPTTIRGSRLEGGTIAFEEHWSVPLGNFQPQATGFGGWTFSAQRLYDDRARELYDGATNRASDPDGTGRATLQTVAGNGLCCDTGEGGLATQAKLLFPQYMAAASDGSFYVSEFYKIKKIDAQGVIRTIAGTGSRGFTPNQLPALNHPINALDVAVGPDDTVYINDEGNFRVRRIVNGIMTTVAGNGIRAFWPPFPIDGRKAIQVPIDPQAIAVGPDGTLYMAEVHRVTSVTPDGIIHLLAGRGDPSRGYCSGDGGPALSADVGPVGIAVGPDGSVYISDGAGAVRRITADGIIRRFAGGCTADHIVFDGERATAGTLNTPWGIAVAVDGSVLIGSPHDTRLRVVTPGGLVYTLAGNGQRDSTPAKNGVMARGAGLTAPWDVKIDGSGSVLFVDYNRNIIRKTQPLFPRGGSIIASPDGSEAHVFQNGRHLRTADTLTGTTLYQLGYDSNGYLTSVTDTDGNVTRIERSGATATAIVAPGGQRTTLTTTGGNLTAITNPAGEAEQFTYDTLGLMQSRRDPRGTLSEYRYDGTGRLVRDTDAAGGFISLVRTEQADGFFVTRTSAEGRTRKYASTRNGDQTETRDTTGPAGLMTTTIRGDGTQSVVMPNGMTADVVETPDPRFGMATPLIGNLRLRTPAGLTLTASQTRSATLTNAADPFSVATITDTMNVNGRSFVTAFDAASRTVTSTSPAGRHTFVTMDGQGRLTSSRYPGFDATNFSYDGFGRLSTISSAARAVSFGYNDRNELVSVTDALSRTTHFSYDSAGRVAAQTQSDGRVIGFTYDKNGNVTSITPPTRPLHSFGFTPVNLTETYAPPPAVAGEVPTRFGYNRDRQLTLITRPDALTVSLTYDAAGRLSSLAIPEGTYTYDYSSASGALQSVTDPDGGKLAFARDGSLMTAATWSGAIAGTVAYTYDNDLSLVSENGVPFRRDPDGLLIAAGELTLQRDADGGQLTGTTLVGVTDSYSYDTHGEMSHYDAAWNGTTLLTFDYTRDQGARIVTTTESVFGSSTTQNYTYDLAGRLLDVTGPGTDARHYDYDANGNRLGATYDAQDRLLSDRDATYTYSANGELRTKTTQAGTTAYDYDVLGNLRRVTLPTGTVITYVDGTNRRIGRKVNGTLEHGWLYADDLRIAAELDGNGEVVSRFVYGTRSNTPDYMEKGGRRYRILSDHLGSPRIVIDAETGEVAQMMGYDEFGNILGDTNPGFQPFGFAGGLFDRDTRLTRFGARDYDARTGRWTVKDPIGFGGGANLYAYAQSDPVNLIDPTGLYAGMDDAVFALGGAAVGLGGQALSDVFSGHASSWQDYTGAAVGGAVGGWALLYTGPVGAGAAGAAAANVTRQSLNLATGVQCSMDWASLARDTSIGALTGVLFGSSAKEGLTVGRNSYNAIYKQMVTKFENGTASNVTAKTATKMFIGRATDTGAFTGTMGGAAIGAGMAAIGGAASNCGCQ